MGTECPDYDTVSGYDKENVYDIEFALPGNLFNIRDVLIVLSLCDCISDTMFSASFFEMLFQRCKRESMQAEDSNKKTADRRVSSDKLTRLYSISRCKEQLKS